MVEKNIIMDVNGVNRALTRISHEILERNKNVKDIVIIGIKNRGIPIANRIAEKIMEIENSTIPVGSLDVTMYRDDIEHQDKKSIQEALTVNGIGIDIKEKTIVLVDDVLYTGRTVRSALDAIIDIARPKAVQLAVLIDRGHRELPIRADYVGKNVPTSKSETIKVFLGDEDKEANVTIYKKLSN